MDDLTNTYWGQNGKYQADYSRLYDALVPASGKCDTVEGELLRAVGKLHHDCYNNGFGNNMTGAVAYVRANFDISGLHLGVRGLEELFADLDYVAPGRCGSVSVADFEELMDRVVLKARDAVATNVLTPNDVDLFDLQTAGVSWYDDEDEEDEEDAWDWSRETEEEDSISG